MPITRGYSRDHRPDLNQVVRQLIVERQAGIPLLMDPLNGNSRDKVSFRDTIKAHIDQLKTDVGLEYLGADSALYTAETLPQMQDFFWFSRVPETLGWARALIQTIAPAWRQTPRMGRVQRNPSSPGHAKTMGFAPLCSIHPSKIQLDYQVFSC